jgi:hypothetical protein
VLVARRFVFFDFNLKAEALILAALGLRWPRVQGNWNGGNVVLFLPRSPFLSQRSFRTTRGTAGCGGRKSHATNILLAAADSDVLLTIREQKHLLHHRSYCRYRHRPQIAPRVLAKARYASRRANPGARDWCCLQVFWIRRYFLGLEELSCVARATCRAFARSRTVDDG